MNSNRATLARQHLLARVRMPASEMVEHLAGLQAQHPMSSYFTLWTRIEDFDPDELVGLMTSREVVRIALMRGTIHTVTADDCLAWRPIIAPVLERMTRGSHGKGCGSADLDELVRLGREFIEEEPRTFAAVGAYLGERWPDAAPTALAQALRAHALLVQVRRAGRGDAAAPSRAPPPSTGSGGRSRPSRRSTAMVLRYLGAVRPGVRQGAMQVWSGVTWLEPVLDRLRPATRGVPRRGRARTVRPARRAAAGRRHPRAGAVHRRLRQPDAVPRRPRPRPVEGMAAMGDGQPQHAVGRRAGRRLPPRGLADRTHQGHRDPAHQLGPRAEGRPEAAPRRRGGRRPASAGVRGRGPGQARDRLRLTRSAFPRGIFRLTAPSTGTPASARAADSSAPRADARTRRRHRRP
ncbi:DNA glycosylase AlkZ-like family protein [Yinghuangia aomiensis]